MSLLSRFFRPAPKPLPPLPFFEYLLYITRTEYDRVGPYTREVLWDQRIVAYGSTEEVRLKQTPDDTTEGRFVVRVHSRDFGVWEIKQAFPFITRIGPNTGIVLTGPHLLHLS